MAAFWAAASLSRSTVLRVTDGVLERLAVLQRAGELRLLAPCMGFGFRVWLQPRASILRANILHELALQGLDGRQRQNVGDAVVVAVVICVECHGEFEDHPGLTHLIGGAWR